MKKLYLLRHAKSDWKEKYSTDFDRTLAKRGKHDAPFMAALLRKMNYIPEVIISSPAVRAVSTAHFFLEEFGFSLDKLVVVSELYLASPGKILDVISSIDDKYSSALITGHNPGITEINNIISNNIVYDFPTCGIAGMESDITEWNDASTKKWNHLFFEYPKKYITD